MDDDGSPGRLSFLDASVPSAFEVRFLVLQPGHAIAFLETEWCDALVVVERGELELEGPSGPAGRFLQGDVLCLVGLGLRTLRCLGHDPTLLAIVRRRRAAP